MNCGATVDQPDPQAGGSRRRSIDGIRFFRGERFDIG